MASNRPTPRIIPPHKLIDREKKILEERGVDYSEGVVSDLMQRLDEAGELAAMNPNLINQQAIEESQQEQELAGVDPSIAEALRATKRGENIVDETVADVDEHDVLDAMEDCPQEDEPAEPATKDSKPQYRNPTSFTDAQKKRMELIDAVRKFATKQDVKHYEMAAISNTRFIKEYSLFNNLARVAFRTLTLHEDDLLRKAMSIYRKSEDNVDYNADMVYYRELAMTLQIHAVSTQDRVTWSNAEVQTVDELIAARNEMRECLSAPMYRLLRLKAVEFQNACDYLQELAQDPSISGPDA